MQIKPKYIDNYHEPPVKPLANSLFKGPQIIGVVAVQSFEFTQPAFEMFAGTRIESFKSMARAA